MFDSQVVHPKNSIPPKSNEFNNELLHIEDTTTHETMTAPSPYNSLSNTEMNIIFDMAPHSSFENRNSTSICANCMFDLEDTR